MIAELNSLLPIIARADGMSRDNASSFGALGMLLVKGVLAYILVRLGRSQKGLEVRQERLRVVLCSNHYTSITLLVKKKYFLLS